MATNREANDAENAEAENGLPEGWADTALGDIASLVSGSGFPLEYQGKTGLKFPVFKVGNLGDVEAGEYLISSPNTVDEKVAKRLHATVIPVNSVVFAKIGMAIHLNRRRLTGVSCLVDNNMMAAVPVESMEPRYVLRYLETVDFGELSQATTVPSIRKGQLAALPIPLPPLAEQRRIVAKVEELLAAARGARRRLERAAEQLKRFKRAVLAAACSGRLTADWRGEAPNGDNQLPNGWVITSPDKVAKDTPNALTIGPFGSNLKVSDYVNSGAPLVFVREIRTEQYGGPNTKFITPQKAEELHSHVVRGGDLLVTKMGEPPGDTSVYPPDRPDGIITADCIKLTPKPGVASSNYLRLCLRTEPARGELLERVMGVAQQKLSLARFREIQFPLPPIEEQTEIVRRVEGLFAAADEAASRVARAQALAARLEQAVLAKAFRGELVPTEAALARREGRPYEPAWELLERIREERGEGDKAEARKRAARKVVS